MGTVISSVNCAHPPNPQGGFNQENAMKRRPVSKPKSAAKFRAQTRRTKAPNVLGLQRGGWRM